MAENKTDLVSEIEDLLDVRHFEYVRRYEASKLLGVLQRAREALRWIPCEERLPEKSGNYRTTVTTQPLGADGLLYTLSFDYFDAKTKQWHGRGSELVAWMEKPAPYTPPKEESGGR